MPKRKPFVCRICDRSFSMAAHLARHSRVHEPAPSKVARKRRANSVRSKISAGQFGTLVASLQDSHRALAAERAALDTQISALESALTVMGAAGAARSGTKVRASSEYRPGSLKDRVGRVLSAAGAPVSIADITAAVVRSGFRSKNKALATSVGIALADMPGVRRVRRGVYGLP